MALQGEAKKLSITVNTCAADGQGCPREGSLNRWSWSSGVQNASCPRVPSVS
jgi:hypothetical protein